MKTNISLTLPISGSYRKRWPVDSGDLVIGAHDEIQTGEALPWFSGLIFEACEGLVVARSIGLWENTDVLIARLRSQGLTSKREVFARYEYLAATCDSAAQLQAWLETVWPNAEAMVCYRPTTAAHESEMLEAASKSLAPYEDGFVHHLPSYELFAFMESGRLSVEFVGYEEHLLRALHFAVATSRR